MKQVSEVIWRKAETENQGLYGYGVKRLCPGSTYFSTIYLDYWLPLLPPRLGNHVLTLDLPLFPWMQGILSFSQLGFRVSLSVHIRVTPASLCLDTSELLL